MKRIDGFIRFQKSVLVRGTDCYGSTCTNKKRFSVRISDIEDNRLFSEVVMHELLHLWLSIVESRTKKSYSETTHHRIINKIIKRNTKWI